MTLTDPRWDDLTNADWDAFAIAWNAELSGDDAAKPLPELPWMLDDPPSIASEYVVPMNFTASAGAQWKFIVAAYWRGNESTHGHLAAGPVEHLLGKHGDDYISLVEQLAQEDPLFAKMLRGCYQNQMSDQVWRRLCRARAKFPATSPGPATQQKQLTLEQKVDAIKSAKRRLKANESQAKIYDDYKNTNIERTIRNVLFNTPPLPRKKRNTWANLLLLLSFVGFCLFTIPFRLDSGNLGFPLLILWGLQLYTAYQIATFYRPGYWSVNVWFLLFLVLRFPTYLKAAQESGNIGPLLASIALGIISAGLSIILLFRLFPNNRPFTRHKLTPQGEPMFDS